MISTFKIQFLERNKIFSKNKENKVRLEVEARKTQQV